MKNELTPELLEQAKMADEELDNVAGGRLQHRILPRKSSLSRLWAAQHRSKTSGMAKCYMLLYESRMSKIREFDC